MEKSVFLFVTGEDYAALTFEDNCNVQEIYNEMIDAGIKKTIIELKDEDGEIYSCLEIHIKEFDFVDKKFEDFVKTELCDYDILKNTNIFRVK